MIIKSIELNNFRIYKGVNRIDFTPNGERNIVIISGNNGFGKTTFLMSLVWCLYGRQMENVDDLYKKEIVEEGEGMLYTWNTNDAEIDISTYGGVCVSYYPKKKQLVNPNEI